MRSVLVTGCSSGIGLETATLLASRGWHVFAGVRDLERRDALDAAVESTGAPLARVEVIQLDVTVPDSIEKAVGYVLEATGGALDAVVHNAGIATGGFFEDLPDEQCRAVMETNFFGVLAVTRAVLPAMRAQRHGRIVCVSSQAATGGSPILSVYTASKCALEGWAESLAMEVAPFGVRVVLVEPGAHRTELAGKAGRFLPDGGPYTEWARRIEQRVEQLYARFARHPGAVAAAIAHVLESPRPRFRSSVGPDAKVAALGRGLVPFEVRARLVRRIFGSPRP